MTPTEQPLPPLLRVPEIAAILGVHEATVYDYLNRGILPGFRVGRGKGTPWRMRRETLERWLAQQEQQEH